MLKKVDSPVNFRFRSRDRPTQPQTPTEMWGSTLASPLILAKAIVPHKMDPVTIATTVFAIAKACAAVAGQLRDFVDGAKLAGLTINVLLENVQGFQESLEQLDSLLKDPRIKDTMHLTGTVGNHWSSLKTCLDKARGTINSLQTSITEVSKDVSLFDSARKHIRLKNAAKKIDLYQQLIRSYKDTVITSQQTLMMFVIPV
jgi:hypothetical protein